MIGHPNRCDRMVSPYRILPRVLLPGRALNRATAF
jgi:hypothetical protein